MNVIEQTQSPTAADVRAVLGSNCLILGMEATGSRVICPPESWTEKTDHDWIVRVLDLRSAVKRLILDGFTWGGSKPENCDEDFEPIISPGTLFASLRRGPLNIIATSDGDFFKRFTLATRVATDLRLTVKGDRIRLFQAILYGNG